MYKTSFDYKPTEEHFQSYISYYENLFKVTSGGTFKRVLLRPENKPSAFRGDNERQYVLKNMREKGTIQKRVINGSEVYISNDYGFSELVREEYIEPVFDNIKEKIIRLLLK